MKRSLLFLSSLCLLSVFLVGCGKPELKDGSQPEDTKRETNEPVDQEKKSNPDEPPMEKQVEAAVELDKVNQKIAELEAYENQGDSEERLKILEIRNGVEGTKFETLTLGDRTISGATVEEISDKMIKISHSGGFATFQWVDLPQAVKEKWGFDPEALERANRKKELMAAQREAWMKSPEGIAAQKEYEEQQEKLALVKNSKQKKDLTMKVFDLEKEIKRGKTAVIRMEEALKAKQEEYQEEDETDYTYDSEGNLIEAEGSRGVKTSKANRDAVLLKYRNQILRAEQTIVELEADLAKVKLELESVR